MFLSRIHIKLFMGSESDRGYICGFSVYTRNGPNNVLKGNVTLDPDSSITTKNC